MSKSRGEKGRSSAQPPPPPQVIVRDLIPGKLNETQWSTLIDDEDGNEFVSSIIDQIIQVTSDQIYDKAIEEEVIPYCVDRVEDYLSEMLKLRFLSHDKGISETDEISAWEEDEAPPTSIPDNWSEGVVPVVIPLTKSILEESEVSDAANDNENIDNDSLSVSNSCDESIVQHEIILADDDDNSVFDDETSEGNETVNKSIAISSRDKEQEPLIPKTSSMFRPYKGKMPAYRNVTLTPVTTTKRKTCQMVCNHGSSRDIQLMQCAPNNSIYGNSKDNNIIAMQKFTPERLPSRRIRTRFEVINQTHENDIEPRSLTKKKLPKIRTDRSDKNQMASNQLKFEHLDTSTLLPLPPPLVDVMMLSPGVVAKVGNTIKSGPKLSKSAIK